MGGFFAVRVGSGILVISRLAPSDEGAVGEAD